MNTFNYKLIFTVTEEYDRFVFSTISNWLFKDYDYIISKELIVEALKYFKENEPEIYKALSEKSLDKNRRDN
jgi:hypothetical protein